mmetsp:Transcript_2910/g.7351  ORF Transcript_2910/g.7351 Transcript_2910/m.7351 type:complete len:1774 (+) Transcript_2910:107-5428(+)
MADDDHPRRAPGFQAITSEQPLVPQEDGDGGEDDKSVRTSRRPSAAGIEALSVRPGSPSESTSSSSDPELRRARLEMEHILDHSSHKGNSLVELSKHLQAARGLDADALARRNGRRRSSARRSSDFARRASMMLPPDPSEIPNIKATEVKVYISDLGHTVLLTSRRLLDTLANQHVKIKLGEDVTRDPNATPVTRSQIITSTQLLKSPLHSSRASSAEDARPVKAGSARKSAPPAFGEDIVLDRRSKRLSDMMKFVSPAVGRRKDLGDLSASGSPIREDLETADAMEEDYLQQSVALSAYVITTLFRIFDTAGRGCIQMRDVRRLQKDLGELGTEEVKSLAAYLMDVSKTFAANHEADEDEDDDHPGLDGRRSSESPEMARRSTGRRTSLHLEEEKATTVVQKRKESLMRRRSLLSGAAPAAESETGEPAVDSAAAPSVAVSLAVPLGVAPSSAMATLEDEEAAPAGDASPVKRGSPNRRASYASSADEDAPLFAADGGNMMRKDSKDKAKGIPAALLKAGMALGAGARAKRSHAMNEAEFYVAVSAWCIHSFDDEPDPEDEDTRELVTPIGVPKLNAKAAAAKKTTAKDRKREKEEAAARQQREEAIARVLAATLAAPGALQLVADNIQFRADLNRINGSAHVEPSTLLELTNHCVLLPQGTTAQMLVNWCKETLELTIDVQKDVTAVDLADHELDSADSTTQLKTLLNEGKDEVEDDTSRVASWNTLVAKIHERRDAKAKDDASGLHSSAKHTSPVAAVLAMFGLGGTTPAKVHSEGNNANEDGVGTADHGDAPWYIISYKHPWMRYVHTVFLILILWDALLIPLYLSYITQSREIEWIPVANACIDGFYIARMILRFHTTFVNERSVETFEPSAVRMGYLSTDFAWDIMASWPMDFLAWVLSADPLVVFGLRLLRLINMRYAFADFKKWKSGLADSDFMGGLVNNLVPLMVAIHYASCVWNVVGHELHQEVTWSDLSAIQQASVGDPQVHTDNLLTLLLDRYVESVFFVLSLVTALGVAQVPANTTEFVGFVVLAVLNMTIYAWSVGGISGVVMKQDDEIVGKRAQLELVHAYVRHIHVPVELKQRMTKYFQERLQHTSLSSISSEQIYLSLPIPMQMEVSAHTNRNLVGGCDLLRGCSNGFLDRVSSTLRERELDADTVIFRVGEACKELIIIATGEVETVDDGAESGESGIEILGQGDALGGVAFVFGLRYFKTARVTSTKKANVYTLSSDSYRELLKTFPSQEDIMMDNAFHQYEGQMTTSRSGKSKLSAGTSDAGGSRAGDARSETGKSTKSEANNNVALHKVLEQARRRREDLLHARLCLACAHGDISKVRHILAGNQVDMDNGDFDGRRALHLAAVGGNIKIVDLILASRADVNVEDGHGDTALTVALLSDQSEVAAHLAKHGGRHGSQSMADRICAAAADPNGVGMLKKLAQFGGNVNAASHEKRTPLHIAASEGLVDNVALLLEHKANPNSLDRNGSTALHDGLASRHDAVCALLVEHKATLDHFDVPANLNNAAATDDTDQLKRLLKFGCSINSQDALGRTPMHLAASCRRINALNFLLDADGANPNVEDNFGNTPLDDASRIEGDQREVLMALLHRSGSKPGSHKSQVAGLAMTVDVEVRRLQALEDRVSMHKVRISQAQLMRNWLIEEKTASTAFKQLMDSAIALEHEKGMILADEMPQLWDQIYEYCEDFLDWKHQATLKVRPLIQSWLSEPAGNRPASLPRLHEKLSDLLLVAEYNSKALERLYECTFRKPVKGDGR